MHCAEPVSSPIRMDVTRIATALKGIALEITQVRPLAIEKSGLRIALTCASFSDGLFNNSSPAIYSIHSTRIYGGVASLNASKGRSTNLRLNTRAVSQMCKQTRNSWGPKDCALTAQQALRVRVHRLCRHVQPARRTLQRRPRPNC